MYEQAKSKGFWFSGKEEGMPPMPGDIYFIMRPDNLGGQCGIVFTVEGDNVASIEANTSDENSGPVAQQDRVALRTRNMRQINGGFARIPQ